MRRIIIKDKNREIKIRYYTLSPRPFIYFLIIFNLLTFFSVYLLIPQGSKANTLVTGNGEDTCSLIKVTLAQNPSCNVLSSYNGPGTCKNPTNGATNGGIGNQTLTITLSSVDHTAHNVTYWDANNFCTKGYLNPNGISCNCVDNAIYQNNQIIAVPANGNSASIRISRSPTVGSSCGSYQFDFSVLAVDGNTNCHYGDTSTGVGAAMTCETGIDCSAAPPPPPPPPPPNCTTTPINCSACTATANTCSNGNGTQTCTLSQPQTCNQVTITRSCTLNNCTNGNICVNQVCQPPTYTVSGKVFIDTNTDGLQNNGETAYTGGLTITSSKGTVTTTATNGTYTVSNIIAGTYTVTYTSLPGGYFMTYPTNAPPSFTVTVGGGCTVNGARGASCNAGNIQNLNFGIHPLYTISGNVFVDVNKNGLIDGEINYAARPAITATKGTVTTNANGSYTITNLSAGTVTVSYTSLPATYYMTSPLNGPPPSYVVTVGNACTTNGAKGASCTNGNITNINFGISNLQPWWQATCSDVRQNGIIDMLPAGTAALISTPSCTNSPGIPFSGNTSANFGQGQISTTNQIVGSSTYPEVYRSSSSLSTSYSFLLSKAQTSSLPTNNLASVCTFSNCSLPANLAHGIYLANGNVTIVNNTYTFSNTANYVFLINGNLTLNGKITVPVTSTVLFSTTGNITVSAAVGTQANNTASSLDGWYIAGRSFIVNSQGNCNDLRLNIGGTVVVNALGSGGVLQNNRDLCGSDATDPTISFSQRLDMLLHAPQFLRQQQTISHEVAP